MRLGATGGSFKTLPESLKEIRVGVLGACRGSLGPDWSNFLRQRGKGEHRNTERGMNKGRNDQRVRARERKGGKWVTRQKAGWGTGRNRVGRETNQKKKKGRQAASGRRDERLRESKERQRALRCQSTLWQLDTTNQTKKWRQVTRQPSPGSLPVWLLPIGYGALKPYSFHCGCHIGECSKWKQTFSFVVFFLSLGKVL